MTRVAIAMDHPIVRELVADAVSTLSCNGPIDIDVAGSYSELLSLRRTGAGVDLVIIDPDIPGADGVRGIAAIVKAFAGIRIVILSGVYDPALARDYIGAGVAGFITKRVSIVSLRNALQVVIDGERYVDAIALLTPEVHSTVATTSAQTE